MTPQRMLLELEALAARLGVAVRSEPFDRGILGGRGGLCRLRGKPAVVMDASLAVPDKIAVLAGALACFDLDSVYLSPLVRARIEAAHAGRSPVARPPRRPLHPGLARTRPRS